MRYTCDRAEFSREFCPDRIVFRVFAAGRRKQHAGRVRYPESRRRALPHAAS